MHNNEIDSTDAIECSSKYDSSNVDNSDNGGGRRQSCETILDSDANLIETSEKVNNDPDTKVNEQSSPAPKTPSTSKPIEGSDTSNCELPDRIVTIL